MSERPKASPARRRASPARGNVPTSRESWELSTTKLGSVANLQRTRSAVPAPGADEVVVSVRAIGLNFADVFCCLGLYEAANAVCAETGGSFCPGLEMAGVATAVGSQVTAIRPGDRVYGFARFGAYRTVVVQRAKLLRPVPASWSFTEAAALAVQGLTAWHGLVHLGACAKGARVLVHSAAGGCGVAAMQICTSLGCSVVGLVGSEAKRAWLLERFPAAEAVLVRGAEKDYAAALAALPGGGFDVVLDALGGGYFTAGLEALRPMGRIVHYGATHSYGGASDGLLKWLTLVPGHLSRPMVDPGKLTPANRSVMGFNLIWLTEREELLMAELEEMMTRGGLAVRPPAVGKTFDFGDMPAALAYLNSGASVGKVVVQVRGDGQEEPAVAAAVPELNPARALGIPAAVGVGLVATLFGLAIAKLVHLGVI